MGGGAYEGATYGGLADCFPSSALGRGLSTGARKAVARVVSVTQVSTARTSGGRSQRIRGAVLVADARRNAGLREQGLEALPHLHPRREVEEPVLKHVGGDDPTLEPRVDAQLDHSPQPIAVSLEQVGQCSAISGSGRLAV